MRPDYEWGLKQLRTALLNKSSQLPPEFAPLETRLQRNLYEARVYGDDQANRVEWTKIMGELIRLADEQLNIDFNELCYPRTQVEIPSVLSLKERAKGKEGQISDTNSHPGYKGTGKRWALLAGVNAYGDKTYPRLRVCVNDLTAICQQLSKSGFATEHMCMLADGYRELPTRENILTTLKTIAQATQPDDLLLFYYSGHGDIDENESYLVARNGRLANLKDTSVPITRVKQIMQGAAARAKVVILDACHGGAALGTKGPRHMSPEFIRRVFEHAEGMAILSSCTQDQKSYEWEKQSRSVFTYYLLEALQGHADNDNKDFVTVSDIHRYVTDRVGEWTVHNKKPQSPTFQAEMAGDIIVCYYSQT